MLEIKMCHINNISEIQNIKSNCIVLRTYQIVSRSTMGAQSFLNIVLVQNQQYIILRY